MAFFWNCLDYDASGVYGRGILKFDSTLAGGLSSLSSSTNVLNFQSPSLIPNQIDGDLVISVPHDASALDFSPWVTIAGDYLPGLGIYASIRWSKVGELDFEPDRTNMAGRMPLDWRGEVWKIMKLKNEIMVYGSGGITKIVPKGPAYGKLLMSVLGIKSQWSIDGNSSVHVFVNVKDELVIITDEVKNVGYEEFLAPMTDPVVTIDKFNALAYICDGTYGYIYSIEDDSMCAGPVNITGMDYSNGVSYVVAAGTITMPTFEILTSVLDFHSRKHKTVDQVEVSTDIPAGQIDVQISYSLGITGPFVATGWHRLGPDGVSHIRCFGKEFKIGIRCQTAQEFSIDWLRIKGRIHEYNPLDSDGDGR